MVITTLHEKGLLKSLVNADSPWERAAHLAPVFPVLCTLHAIYYQIVF